MVPRIAAADANVAKGLPASGADAPGRICSTGVVLGSSPFRFLAQLQEQVREKGACSLPGVSIDYDRFMTIMWRAVSVGWVTHSNAEFVSHGLWHGFDCGLDVSLLKGRRRFKNYKSALEARAKVTKATRVRVNKSKTLMLAKVPVDYNVQSLSKVIPWNDYRIFPMAAVPKAMEPDEVRPVSDHTKTGLKDATCDQRLKHTLTAVEDIQREFQFAYSMVVGDVDAAYPLLPLAWWIWQYFMFVWFDVREEDESTSELMYLYIHLCGDFGTSGFPGTFKIFFTDVVVNMARSMSVLTLPMPVFVDDMGLIGAVTTRLEKEWAAFKLFLREIGVPMKELKERLASTVQLMLGFWWDSVQRTRTLDGKKLAQYFEMFRAFARSKSLSLTQLQSCAGRMQRSIMTLPPGAACMLASVYALMSGLTLGFQKRRVTKAVRTDLIAIHDLLHLNLGRGYFSYDQFGRAPTVWTDASKQARYAGGGYVSSCGAYRWWRYGSSAARQPIDFLEGDAVVLCAEDLGPGWFRCVVPIFLDNTAFERSATKGRSRAERLNDLLRRLFALSLKYECIFEFHWLSTHVNKHADALSREDGEQWFLDHVYEDGIWLPGPARRHPLSGHVRCLGKACSADVAGDGPRRTAPEFVMAVSFPRASIFDGLPTELHADVQAYMDARLRESSLRTVSAALGHWRPVCERFGWPELLLSDDPSRGGKLAAFVHSMAEDTSLSWGSISNYVWGLRAHMKSKGQVDPIFGVYDWADFMTSVHVKTWTVGEPRRAVPLDLLRRALRTINLTVFWEVQMGLFICVYLFGFSRSEHPCPKTLTGFDPSQNAQVRDLCMMEWRGSRCLAMRLKVIKQDPRMERPEAAGNEDWVYIGDADDPQFSVFTWLQRVYAFHGRARPAEEPFFLHPDQRQVLTYGTAMAQFRTLLQRVSDGATAALYGLHSLRVSGWNGARTGPDGEEVAVAHGGWHGGSQRRYDRFAVSSVLNLPTVILGADAHHFDDRPVAAVVPASPPPVNPPRARKRARSSVGGETSAAPPVARPRPTPGKAPARPGWRGYVMESDDDDSVPHDRRCSNYVRGCTVISLHGRHAGTCSHVLLDAPRRSDSRRV